MVGSAAWGCLPFVFTSNDLHLNSPFVKPSLILSCSVMLNEHDHPEIPSPLRRLPVAYSFSQPLGKH
jgi:hypothetical protein